MSDQYFDIDGFPITLDALCANDPAWAANRIRAVRSERDDAIAERDTYRAALIACRTESKWAGHGATVQGLALHAVGDIVEAAFVEVSK